MSETKMPTPPPGTFIRVGERDSKVTGRELVTIELRAWGPAGTTSYLGQRVLLKSIAYDKLIISEARKLVEWYHEKLSRVPLEDFYGDYIYVREGDTL